MICKIELIYSKSWKSRNVLKYLLLFLLVAQAQYRVEEPSSRQYRKDESELLCARVHVSDPPHHHHPPTLSSGVSTAERGTRHKAQADTKQCTIYVCVRGVCLRVEGPAHQRVSESSVSVCGVPSQPVCVCVYV